MTKTFCCETKHTKNMQNKSIKTVNFRQQIFKRRNWIFNPRRSFVRYSMCEIRFRKKRNGVRWSRWIMKLVSHQIFGNRPIWWINKCRAHKSTCSVDTWENIYWSCERFISHKINVMGMFPKIFSIKASRQNLPHSLLVCWRRPMSYASR